MNILLINPPKEYEHKLNVGVKLAYSLPRSLPPINLLYIAAPIKKRGEHNIEILDAVCY